MGRRRWFRNSQDSTFQGDGWRWSLSLALPNVLLWRYASGAPFTLDMLPLSTVQRMSCREEWRLTQAGWPAS